MTETLSNSRDHAAKGSSRETHEREGRFRSFDRAAVNRAWGDRWTPEDDAELLRLVSEGCTMAQAGEAMNRTRNACTGRYNRLCGIVGEQPPPPDFAARAAVLTRLELMAHYDRGADVITRWCRQAGVKPYRPPLPRYRRERRVVSVIDTRDDSEASRAQSYLQRFYPVWRCNPDGTFNPKGSHFRCDGITRTTEEMIERAKRKGWNPDEWRQAA